MQMANESKQRVHEAKEAAANRLQLNSLKANIAGAYFEKSKRNNCKKRKRANVSSSSSEESDSSSDESHNSSVGKKRSSERSAD